MKVPKEDFFPVAAKPEPEAAKLKRKAATVHFSEEEEKLDEQKKGRKGASAAPEKDTSVIFSPVRTVTLKFVLPTYIYYLIITSKKASFKLKNKYVVKAKASSKGRPEDKVIAKLSLKLWDKEKHNPYFACRGALEGCDFVCSGFAQRNRLAPHAVNCRFLSTELKDLVADQAAGLSLGAKQEARDPESAPGKSDLNILS